MRLPTVAASIALTAVALAIPAASASAAVSPVAAVSAGVGTPAKSVPGKLKTTCGLTSLSGVAAAGWAQRSSSGRAWAWQGKVKSSSERTLNMVVAALDRCPGVGILTTDWDSDGLEDKTVMLTGLVAGRPVTLLVYSHGDLITVAGAVNTKPYRQEREVLLRTMLAQGVKLSPIAGT